MTPGELAVWRAVYAVAWLQPTGRVTPGAVTDEERAAFAAREADRAVKAARLLAVFEPHATSGIRVALQGQT